MSTTRTCVRKVLDSNQRAEESAYGLASRCLRPDSANFPDSASGPDCEGNHDETVLRIWGRVDLNHRTIWT